LHTDNYQLRCVVFPQLRNIYNAIGVEYFYD
jgi:hypothetical protein